MTRKPAFSSRICAMKLRPGFLEETDPEFVFAGASECELVRTLVHRKVVIDNDRCLDSVDVELHKIDAFSIYFLSLEQGSDSIWKLSHGAQHRKEVAVPDHALIDVVAVDIFVENDWVVKYFGCSFPF